MSYRPRNISKNEIISAMEDHPLSLDLDAYMTANFGKHWKPEVNTENSISTLNPDLLKSDLLLKFQENNLIGYYFMKHMIGLGNDQNAVNDALKTNWKQIIGVFKGKILNIIGNVYVEM